MDSFSYVSGALRGTRSIATARLGSVKNGDSSCDIKRRSQEPVPKWKEELSSGKARKPPMSVGKKLWHASFVNLILNERALSRGPGVGGHDRSEFPSRFWYFEMRPPSIFHRPSSTFDLRDVRAALSDHGQWRQGQNVEQVPFRSAWMACPGRCGRASDTWATTKARDAIECYVLWQRKPK